MAVITISREFGSGGDWIANKVHELLGYRLFDKQLIARAAMQIGLPEHEIVDFPEQEYRTKNLRTRLRELLFSPTPTGSGTVDVSPVLSWGGLEARMDDQWFVELVSSTIREAYEQGDVVIVGRGGQAILQEKPGVLHVRIESSLARRERRLHEDENLSIEDARTTIRQHDQRSANYLKQYFNVRWNDPLLYHLIINTDKVSLELAVQLIVTAVQQMEVVAA